MREEDNDLDKLFKKRLQDSEDIFAFNEEDWLDMEARLDQKEKRRWAIYLIRFASAVAAMLLIYVGWWFFKPLISDGPINAVKEQVSPLPRKDKPIIAPINEEPQKPVIAENFQTQRRSQSTNETDHQLKLAKNNSVPTSFSSANLSEVKNDKMEVKNTDVQQIVNVSTTSNNNTDSVKIEPQIIAYVEPQPEKDQSLPEEKTEKILKKEVKKSSIRFAITAIAAPDLNGSGTLNQSKVGSNVGLLFSIGISKKVTIGTGLIYADKPYNGNSDKYTTTFTNPYAAKYIPTSVNVQCKMFDLPLTIDYEIFGNQANLISLGTGVSSYFMLHENYQYNFDPATYYAAKSYDVPNSKAYLFSILNLSATYERKLNKTFGLIVQPYLKVPLRDIGYGEVKLRSTGLAVGLKWNFSQL